MLFGGYTLRQIAHHYGVSVWMVRNRLQNELKTYGAKRSSTNGKIALVKLLKKLKVPTRAIAAYLKVSPHHVRYLRRLEGDPSIPVSVKIPIRLNKRAITVCHTYVKKGDYVLTGKRSTCILERFGHGVFEVPIENLAKKVSICQEGESDAI